MLELWGEAQIIMLFTGVPQWFHCMWPMDVDVRHPGATLLPVHRNSGSGHDERLHLVQVAIDGISVCERAGGRANKEDRIDWGDSHYFSPPHPPDIYSSNDAPKRPLDSKLIKCLLGSQTVIYFSKDASIISKEKPGYIFKTQEQQLLNLFRLMSTYKFGEC